MIGRQEQKLERLYLTYIDKLSIAETMRRNLASDIIAGYHLANVTKQMVQIKEYEKTVVEAVKKEYEDYRARVIEEREYVKYEQKFRSWIDIKI